MLSYSILWAQVEVNFCDLMEISLFLSLKILVFTNTLENYDESFRVCSTVSVLNFFKIAVYCMSFSFLFGMTGCKESSTRYKFSKCHN